MKNILLLLLAFITFNSLTNSQSRLDDILLEKINVYRIENGLNTVSFDSSCYRAAECQSSYLALIDTILTHRQNVSKFEKVDDRYKYFGGGNALKLAEICNSAASNHKKDDNDEYLNLIADKIITSWKNSKGHNDVMIDPSYNFIGVSVNIKEVPTNFRNLSNFTTKSVAVFSKK